MKRHTIVPASCITLLYAYCEKCRLRLGQSGFFGLAAELRHGMIGETAARLPIDYNFVGSHALASLCYSHLRGTVRRKHHFRAPSHIVKKWP